MLIEMVVAAIDGEPVTSSDVKRYAALSGRDKAINLAGGDSEVRALLRELLVDRMLTREAERLGITVDEEAVAIYLQEIQRQNGVDQAGFRALLEERGISFDDYRRQVRSDILRTRVIGSQVRAKVQISDEDIDRYLAANSSTEDPEEGTIALEQIFERFEDGDSSQDREEKVASLRELRDEIGSERSRWKTDERYIYLGFVDPADLLNELRVPVQELEIGEVSDVVITERGAYLLRRSSGRESSSNRDEIKQELMQAEVAKRLQSYLNDELPKKYHVEILL